VADLDGTARSYTDVAVVDGHQYTYRVTALDAAGHESPASNSVSVTTDDVTKPTPPTSVTASASGGNVQVSWSGATDNVGVTAYKVYRNDLTQPLATVTSGTTYTDTTVHSGTSYTYRVTALDAAGNESDPSAPATVGSADTVPPTVPTGLTAHASAGQVKLTWTAATDDVGVTGYRVYRSDKTGPLATVTDGTTYTDSTVGSGTSYTYRVSALDAAGNESGRSTPVTVVSTDTAAPTVPTGLTGHASAGQVKLAWTAATDDVGVTGYRVYRSDRTAPLTTVRAGTTYTDTAVRSATSYTYRVSALDAAGNESGRSAPVTVSTPDAAPPAAPTSVRAAAAGDTSVVVTWSADGTGATGYDVYRNGGATPVGSVDAAARSFTDTGLSADTTYTYTVKARGGAGTSTASAPASARTWVFGDGFETGDFSRWSHWTGIVTSRTQKSSGSYGAVASAGKRARPAFATRALPSTYRDLTYRVRFMVPRKAAATTEFMRLRTASGANILALSYGRNGALGYHNDVRHTSRTSRLVIRRQVWQQATVRVQIRGARSRVSVWLNGHVVRALTRADNLGRRPVGQVVVGETTPRRGFRFAVDDVQVTRRP
jgi:fibronectin type 3 domain-containing protein